VGDIGLAEVGRSVCGLCPDGCIVSIDCGGMIDISFSPSFSEEVVGILFVFDSADIMEEYSSEILIMKIVVARHQIIDR